MHITEHSTSSSYKLVGEVAGVLKMTGKGRIDFCTYSWGMDLTAVCHLSSCLNCCLHLR